MERSQCPQLPVESRPDPESHEDRNPEVAALVDALNQSGARISLDWSFGKPCATDRSSGEYISRRMSAEEMKLWLDGFSTGIDQNPPKEDGTQRETVKFLFSLLFAAFCFALLSLLY